MKKKIIPFTLVITGFLIGATALSVMAQTWTAPTCSPPNCNISAPVLTGSSVSPINLQTRYGALQISGNFGIAGNLIYNPGGTITQGEVLTALDSNGTVGWSSGGGTGGSPQIAIAYMNSSSAGGGTVNLTEVYPNSGYDGAGGPQDGIFAYADTANVTSTVPGTAVGTGFGTLGAIAGPVCDTTEGWYPIGATTAQGISSPNSDSLNTWLFTSTFSGKTWMGYGNVNGHLADSSGYANAVAENLYLTCEKVN